MSDNDQILDWIGRLGAVTASDVASRFDLPPASVHGRLATAERRGLIARRRLLHDQPALFVATAAGLRSAGLEALAPARVSASSFEHWRACASVAVALEGLGTHRVIGDRELRALERASGRRLASTELGLRRSGEPDSHHPDLVLIGERGGPPVAVEVEIAVKAPRRLHGICRAWGRSRTIAGVVYCASPRARRALRRTVGVLAAEELIAVVALDPVLAGDGTAVAAAVSRLEAGAAERRAERPAESRVESPAERPRERPAERPAERPRETSQARPSFV
jgi:hypothetical protein